MIGGGGGGGGEGEEQRLKYGTKVELRLWTI